MIPSHGMREVVVRSQHGRHSQHQSSAQQSKTGLVSGYSDAVVISAEPQVFFWIFKIRFFFEFFLLPIKFWKNPFAEQLEYATRN